MQLEVALDDVIVRSEMCYVRYHVPDYDIHARCYVPELM